MPPPLTKKSKPSPAVDEPFRAEDPRTLAQRSVPAERRRNALFEAYYRTQLFSANSGGGDGSIDEFLSTLKIPSPMTLRVQQTAPLAIRQRTIAQVKRAVSDFVVVSHAK